MARKLEYNKNIANHLRWGIRNGVPIKTLLAEIQKYQFAPKSFPGLYNNYGQDIEEARSEIIGAIGNKVVEQALNGDPEHPNTWKAREFFLRSKGDWSPNATVETRETGTEEEENESAVDALMNLLGKGDEEEEDES
jgi:hypothetical protein